MPLRVLLVDDCHWARRGVAALLATLDDVAVAGEAVDGRAGLEMARQTAPDVILMDVHMPGCSGLETTRLIKCELPQVHIIMYTVGAEDPDLFTALKSGAEGYLLKNLEPVHLFEALTRVRRGEVAICRTMAPRILLELGQIAGPDALTPGERETLVGLAQGATEGEVALALGLDIRQVRGHMRDIMAKLHRHGRAQEAAPPGPNSPPGGVEGSDRIAR